METEGGWVPFITRWFYFYVILLFAYVWNSYTHVHKCDTPYLLQFSWTYFATHLYATPDQQGKPFLIDSDLIVRLMS